MILASLTQSILFRNFKLKMIIKSSSLLAGLGILTPRDGRSSCTSCRMHIGSDFFNKIGKVDPHELRPGAKKKDKSTIREENKFVDLSVKLSIFAAKRDIFTDFQ